MEGAQFFSMWLAFKVLLATGSGHPVCLEIGDGILTEMKHAQLEYDVAARELPRRQMEAIAKGITKIGIQIANGLKQKCRIESNSEIKLGGEAAEGVDRTQIWPRTRKSNSEGRILVFVVEDPKLQLTAEKETKGDVYSINALNGKLLAATNQKIQSYKWMLRDDGNRELQSDADITDTYLPFMFKLVEISLWSVT
ncbi:DNA damage-binding protein 1a [Sarracenia purpurea var. burkii]